MIEALFKELDGAFAENTLRAYRADFAHFASWCKARDIDPWESTAVQWADYVAALEPTHAAATIRRRMNSLNSLFKLVERTPHRGSRAVRLALRRMHRRKGRRQRQATPLTMTVLKALLPHCDGTPRGQRDRILLMLGYETMRRRAELVRYRFSNLEVRPQDRYAILLERSKTDQFADGHLIGLSPVLGRALVAWHGQIGDGPILRPIHNGVLLPRGLEAGAVNRILRRLQRAAGLTAIGALSGHSFRVGRALDLLEQGETLEKIMLRGGWKSDSAAISYLRAWHPEASNLDEDAYE